MVPFICLMYHSLEAAPSSQYSITFDEFQAQLAWLQGEGFVVEGFRELARRLALSDLPSRYVVMSFDDGHESAVRAAEMVRSAGAQATFFLTKNFCEQRSDFLKPDAIRKLGELCSLGSHGVSHKNLARLDDARLDDELATSKRWLEDLTGGEVNALSAPGGLLSARVVAQATRIGYSLVGNSVEWWNEPGQVRSSRVVNRVCIRSIFPARTFDRILRRDPLFFVRRRVRGAVLEIPKRLLPQAQMERLAVLAGRSQRH
jgi:peptidoglycan/xylan/chitin deacetylase (PgdA/CDA1 family)